MCDSYSQNASQVQIKLLKEYITRRFLLFGNDTLEK